MAQQHIVISSLPSGKLIQYNNIFFHSTADNASIYQILDTYWKGKVGLEYGSKVSESQTSISFTLTQYPYLLIILNNSSQMFIYGLGGSDNRITFMSGSPTIEIKVLSINSLYPNFSVTSNFTLTNARIAWFNFYRPANIGNN